MVWSCGRWRTLAPGHPFCWSNPSWKLSFFSCGLQRSVHRGPGTTFHKILVTPWEMPFLPLLCCGQHCWGPGPSPELRESPVCGGPGKRGLQALPVWFCNTCTTSPATRSTEMQRKKRTQPPALLQFLWPWTDQQYPFDIAVLLLLFLVLLRRELCGHLLPLHPLQGLGITELC